MKFALVNPNWSFHHSVYFGCREPHLPLEFGYAKALLEARGHDAALFDAQLEGLHEDDLAARVRDYAPDFTVVTTAPSYLFWRCPPPELRVPQQVIQCLRDYAGQMIAVGPHASATPGAALKKLSVDAVITGEFEQVLPHIAEANSGAWRHLAGLCYLHGTEVKSKGEPLETDMKKLPPLRWPKELLERHRHHHHRFDQSPAGPGAEVEASRGCPYGCCFCARQRFRNRYRKRPLKVVLEEVDALIAQGVEYIYFIDEIFMPDEMLLHELDRREILYGVQTRLDVWDDDEINLLGRSGCVSVEAGVECISEDGRQALSRRCQVTTEEITRRLILAKQTVRFVQANLIEVPGEDPALIEKWRQELREHGVWANKPVPMFPFPGSPAYEKMWGPPDDNAWERAHDYYLMTYSKMSDIQDQQPLPLDKLELKIASHV